MSSIELMTELLGSNYQIVTQDGFPIVIQGSLDLAADEQMPAETPDNMPDSPVVVEKNADDYLFQIYVGSLTVVGLFVLFRMIRKSR